MKITVEEVNYIAKLAKLSFSEEESERLAEEFESILSHFESIDKFNLDDIDLNIYDKNSKSVLRKDEAKVFEDKQKLFSNVKTMRDTAILVPKIIE